MAFSNFVMNFCVIVGVQFLVCVITGLKGMSCAITLGDQYKQTQSIATCATGSNNRFFDTFKVHFYIISGAMGVVMEEDIKVWYYGVRTILWDFQPSKLFLKKSESAKSTLL